MDELVVYVEAILKSLEKDDDIFLRGYKKAMNDILEKIKRMEK